MLSVLFVIAAVLTSEIVLGFLFSAIAQIFYQKTKIDFKSVAKGFIERMFLLLFLFNDLAPALTFFSALKLATRLKHDESTGSDSNKFNDYYLVGNLLSVSVALFYTYILNHTQKIETILSLL
ncbi:hypothetical protein [Dyadobacter pollutisoli]|uniref:Uncharacterized protein n=1 Tax=Dyadobacter pollutisoli TaxID=2910158 RepID=A0A9E8NGF8_9BACT|nr:hypothetical protein [Dyadobacter pollutisoli]WAC13812.1 hypothetical protein ON006_07585 [Dyadobacter pollutisoli]